MIKIYTIGFTQKNAKHFFELLKGVQIERLIDVRVNNSSQLAGFAKGRDLEYFCKEILDCEYLHFTDLAPTKELLKSYSDKKIAWTDYEKIFNSLLQTRDISKRHDISIFDNACLLCSEAAPEQCHRRLVAEFLKRKNPDKKIEILHLI